ncbi:hypothetical protein Forpe1208_v016358 [Fusarium oxysporum f. sp. rapae]|uniref:Uncharacterized protein n=1 Tax=Fusarium oxysporum f. sp. rapae TaxID=485398 RepID=A0A8J5NE09_FUSOX|nr:hypothetical protein Forpe1208_v016358 [Fusarium oxysporum f. sp. rapae]
MDIEALAVENGIDMEDTPDLSSKLALRGVFLLTPYERTKEMRDLEEAIQGARQAVALKPDDDPYLANWLSNLGAVLARRLNNLGNKLGQLYERIGEMEDLERAIQVVRLAVESTPDDHSGLADCLNNLGIKFGMRYERTGETNDLEDVSTFLLKAWTCLNAVPFRRVQAAAKCVQLLAIQNRVDEGIDLGREILAFLPSVHTRSLDRNDQQFVVSTLAGVASNLCSVLLSANRLSEALECLEQGRAIIISQLLDDRSGLSSLRQDHSQLADQYQSLVDEVYDPIRQITPDAVEALIRKRQQEAAAALDTCLKEIRRVPGHERFMLGQTVAEMQECITEGSIVVINITDFRSDAIIISSNSLRTVALAELSASDARSWVSKDWSTKKKFEQ